MERFFIVVVDDFSDSQSLDDLAKELAIVSEYRALADRPCAHNAISLPSNQAAIKWAVCARKTCSVVKGFGLDEFKAFSDRSKDETDHPTVETWNSECFSSLTSHAIDVILVDESGPEFWKSFNLSNAVRVYLMKEKELLNHQLYWRGNLKMKEPRNLSTNFGLLEKAELSYKLGELDLLVSKITNEILSPRMPSQVFLCPTMELVSAVQAQTFPHIFYSSTSLLLTVPHNSLQEALNKKVALLFRLDYATEEVENWEKEADSKCIFFLSHLVDEELHLWALKSSEDVQNLVNIFVKSKCSLELSNRLSTASGSFTVAPMVRMEKEIRRLQLVALRTWIQEKGAIDEETMTKILDQVARVVCQRQMKSAADQRKRTVLEDRPDLSEYDLLKWKLSKPSVEVERPVNNTLLQPNGKTLTVDVNYILRCMGNNRMNAMNHRSPRKTRNENRPPIHSRLKPSTDLHGAQTAQWPDSFLVKYHGIDYNVDTEREKAEKQLVDYQNKWVPQDTSSWCNPWSFHSSVAYQLSTVSTNVSKPAVEAQARTPRKSIPRDLILLRKSPRLLAKNEPRLRRTPVKKGATPSKMDPKVAFKQKLKVVIIKVLSEHGISPKDQLFRTCANKLSVICMELLKDAKSVASSRQMYGVAKSHAKQVIQFVKDK